MKKKADFEFYVDHDEYIVSVIAAPENTWVVYAIKDKGEPDFIVAEKVVYYALLKAGYLNPMIVDVAEGPMLFTEIPMRYHFGPYETIKGLSRDDQES